jgi:adenylate cyclase, class 2
MFEVELKAKLSDPAAILARLRRLAVHGEQWLTYYDQYYETPSNNLRADERELRIRRVEGKGVEDCFLTAKSPPFHTASGSKREFEVRINDAHVAAQLLKTIGFVEDIGFVKECRHFHLIFSEVKISATVVRIKELMGTFLEAEVLVRRRRETTRALRILHELLSALNVPASAVTRDYYTDAVRAKKSSG